MSSGTSPIEIYMAKRDSQIDTVRKRLSGEYDPIIINGVVTDYGINRSGDVYSFKTDKKLNPAILQGKRKVTICYQKDGKRFYRGIWVDRLVADTYLTNPNHCKYIGHKNGDPLDDSAGNIEWTNEKPCRQAGYTRNEIALIFDRVMKLYNDNPSVVAHMLDLKDWIVLRIRAAVQHMVDGNMEISSDTFLSNFKTLIVNGSENHRYKINPFGIVYQVSTGCYRLGSISVYGYVISSIVGIGYQCRTHRLVAETFIPNPDHLPEVHHKNGLTYDPCLWNLEWVTHQENMNEASDLGQMKRGMDLEGVSKYTDDQIHHVCRMICQKKHPNEIMHATGVSYETIKEIRRGEAWEHISQYYRFPYVQFRHGKIYRDDPEKAKEINDKIQRKMERSSYGTNC